jgi:hypothetical protein
MNWMRRTMAGLAICATALAADGPKGTVPRAAPEKYGVHAEQKDVAIGATLLTAGDTRKVFHTDVNRCCVVVEVALFPKDGGSAEVSLNDFALRIVGQDVGAKPSSARVVAWRSSHDTDRLRPRLIEDMEIELTEKGLPTGSTPTPVSGYLYFAFEKIEKKAKYLLEYGPRGGKVALALD